MKALWLVSAFFLCASSAGAQTCKVLDPELATGTYTGACKDGLASGQGTVKPKAVAGVAPGAGASYVGDFVEGRKQGAGVKTYANGDTYTGAWQQDQRSGFGIYYYGVNSPWAGDRYQGGWLADRMHGDGSYIWALGDKYDGAWSNGAQASPPTPVQQQRKRYVTAFVPALTAAANRVCASGADGAALRGGQRGTAIGLIDDRILIRFDGSTGDSPPPPPRWDSVAFWVPCK
jgi:hypothetical protein